ncbi:hypothetical protein HID58_011005 [Brassica napus]|uniref:Pectin acetylesterase n=1 Tax=Brassica napus TaxID=3708 RepID=A0ABQ8DXD3_BRANA|nr:hypothetical protein HID58_011005 [Brassica napus]
MVKLLLLVGLIVACWLILGTQANEYLDFNVTEIDRIEELEFGFSKYSSNLNPLLVGLTLIRGADSGAVCLDGTLPGYHLHRGHGSGANSWLIQLEEDGATMSGHVYTGRRLDAAQLQFRGERIWRAAIDDLKANGMRYADQALLSGCSAGGLAAILRCDEFRDLFPGSTKVKCLSDAGLFLDTADVSGGRTIRNLYNGIVEFQSVKNNLPRICTNHLDPTSCFFPENLISQMKTPLFIVNAAYDTWQIQSSIAPKSADPSGFWHDCRLNHEKCTSGQMRFLQSFRDQMLRVVKGFSMSRQNGLFINSCFAHCQTERQDTWFADDSPVISKKAVAIAVGDWYFDRAEVKLVDCPYPCDKSCHNMCSPLCDDYMCECFSSTNDLKLLKFEPCPLLFFVLLPSGSSFMASDSQTATATISEKPLETKVNDEAKLMEKEIVLSETVDVVKDKPVSDSNLTIEEEKTVQTPAGVPEKEIPADVEEAAEVVKADESNDKGKDENVVNVQADDVEKAEEGKGKDENGEEKVAEQVELKEPTLVKESVEEVKIEAEEKLAVESVAEEDNNDTEEEKKMVHVSESTDEAVAKQVEPVDVHLVREVSEETVEDKVKDAEVLEVEPKVEVVRTEEPTVQAEVELEGKLEDSTVETKDSKDEQTSESGSSLCPKETVTINQDSDTATKIQTDGDASSPPDVIEKPITEEKQVVEEPSKDEKEKVSEEAKATEDENIKKDTETPAADVQSEETLKETEGTKQEESITEKVPEVAETATVAKEIEEPKPQPEVTTKEEVVKPKHSNSIMSKVKQSLVKAKKAIIGKSPSSKTITTEETKEEIIAK